MSITNTAAVIIMGRDENIMCNAVSARAHQGQAVLQRKGEPRVAARLAGSMTSWAAPQALAKKSRIGPVTASRVSQECRSPGQSLGTAVLPGCHVHG